MTARPPITCEACGQPAPWRGGAQRYCVPCSEQRDLKRKAKWARDNGQTYNLENRRERNDTLRRIGAERGESPEIGWDAGAPISLLWRVCVAVPFSYRMSKNAIFGTSKFGHTYLRKEAKQHRARLVSAVHDALHDADIRVAQNKLWMDLFVAKPDHRGDALNLIDLVADAVKEAAGLDDRWFSFRRMDWMVSKDRPIVYVGLGQETAEDAIVCSFCGRILPLERFGKHKSGPLGQSRICKQCSRLRDHYGSDATLPLNMEPYGSKP